MTCCSDHGWRQDGHHDATYEEGDFERWRKEMFAAADLIKIVDFITKLTKHRSHPHHFEHLGLSACCRCGWEEREYNSTSDARLAWWEHAEELMDWDAIEAEHVLTAF